MPSTSATIAAISSPATASVAAPTRTSRLTAASPARSTRRARSRGARRRRSRARPPSGTCAPRCSSQLWMTCGAPTSTGPSSATLKRPRTIGAERVGCTGAELGQSSAAHTNSGSTVPVAAPRRRRPRHGEAAVTDRAGVEAQCVGRVAVGPAAEAGGEGVVVLPLEARPTPRRRRRGRRAAGPRRSARPAAPPRSARHRRGAGARRPRGRPRAARRAAAAAAA